MIDGVDVSTCSERGETINGITCGNGERIRLANEIITKHKLCKDSPNCAYKQLAHKTQECEELKGRLKYIREENKYLKESATDEQIDFVALNNNIKALEFQLDQLKASKEQAEQKLEKVRRVCAETKDVGENIKDMYTAKLSGLYLKSRQILQIIDEVE